MEKYLKPYQHYADLYDRHTVDMCRRTEKSFEKEIEVPEGKDVSKEELSRVHRIARELYLHAERGERYLKRETTIREWMDADRKRDELYESAQAPEDIRCLACRNRVKPTFKQLWSQGDKGDRVLFMYECPNKCLPHRAFFNDGEEWRTKPDPCLKCNTPLTKSSSEEKEDGYVVISTCPACGHVEREEHEWFKPKEEEVDLDFAKDRDRFCLTEEEGKKYQDEKWQMERLGKLMEEIKEKEKLRDEKLAANPGGFDLDGVGYQCFVCGTHTGDGDNWYDQYGIKCLVCQKAIDNGEIPASLAKEKDTWYSKYDLESRFNLKGATLRKWIKEGIIKSRTVSRYGEGVHVELFLLEDNEGFLPPKKLVESQPVREKRDGEIFTRIAPWYQLVDPFEHLKDYGIIKHMRIVPEEEMKQREEEKQAKQKAKDERRERLKAAREGKRKK